MAQTQSIKNSVEDRLMKLMKAKDLGEITQELCDFPLKKQNTTSSQSHGVQPTASSDFIPILGETVTYIVACVLINEQEEVLMMQEAKQSCKGKWYLPAGRMEAGETICQAAAREVLEETGLLVSINTLLAVESGEGTWFRFVLTGSVTGGTLKTLNQADKESLQAKWFNDLKDLKLRSNDILPLIDTGRTYKARHELPPETSYHADVLPTICAHHKNYVRVIATIRNRDTNSLRHILVSKRSDSHFPIVEVHPERSIKTTLRNFMLKLFGDQLPDYRMHGLFSVEHQPSAQKSSKKTDGVCLNLLVVFQSHLEEVSLMGAECIWSELSRPIDEKLSKIISSKYSTIQLKVLES